MEKLNRGDKIYLDFEKTKESAVNTFLDCRDGIVRVAEYEDESGYGSLVRLFICEDAKHETVSIIRQTWGLGEWTEECLSFDSDSFQYLKSMINYREISGAKYTVVRNYNESE